jgi:hypothetical protein
MKRRDLISAVLGLPAMAGMKAAPLVPGESMDAEVPSAGATKGGEPPFVIVLQPDRALPTATVVRIREQMTEFLDSAGVNAKAVVLPCGLSIKTLTADGVVHGVEPEPPPATKPWCGQLVYDWFKASGITYRNFTPVSRRRSFDVIKARRGWLLNLKTVVDDSPPYVTEGLVIITVNNEVCPYDAAWIIDVHERGLAAQKSESLMAELEKLVTPKKGQNESPSL